MSSQRTGPVAVAGTTKRIKLENFMCHSNLEIPFSDHVNFITGQNGSGKSAILTALCVAFGSRAMSTNRAATLKDFIKTGCSYASVQVEVKNEGEDAFKPDVYGDVITVERRITDSTSSTVLKDQRGRRISTKKEELRELVEHFNIDVENPCVIMTQDKSREFLHSGSSKDKFKFFFKATLLQQVDELLNKIGEQLEFANGLVHDLQKSIEPVLSELAELQEKIRNMEHLEELSERVKEMKFKLAWSWVYQVDADLLKQSAQIEKMKARVPTCQAEINKRIELIEGLAKTFEDARARCELMKKKTSEVENLQNDYHQRLSMASKVFEELVAESCRRKSELDRLLNIVRSLEQQARDVKEQNLQNTQAEESEMLEKVTALEEKIKDAKVLLMRLKDEEKIILDKVLAGTEDIKKIRDQIDNYERQKREIKNSIQELQRNQTNKVTAFGGERVLQLLRIIESYHYEFTRPPIGPIGAHVTLSQADVWAFAVENAVGRLLNAFIVTNVKDSHLLRSCARKAHYDNLQIIIYDFSIPRYNIPPYRLPQTRHPTTLSILQSDNATVLNVLVDKGSAERQVLVMDYDTGKGVAFDGHVSNLKEVYTAEGYKMFSRRNVQTTLPPNKRARSGRLCGSYDDQIKDLQRKECSVQEIAQEAHKRKRAAEEELRDLRDKSENAKRRCLAAERNLETMEISLDDAKRAYAAESSTPDSSSVDELHEEILRTKAQIHEKEALLEKLEKKQSEARHDVDNIKGSLSNLVESANEDIAAFCNVEEEFENIRKELNELKGEKEHYEKLLNEKFLASIKLAQEKYVELENKRKESYEKASCICPENEIESLGGCKESTPEQLSAQLTRMMERLQRAKNMYTESIEDLRMLHEKKKRKIYKKQKTYENFQLQLEGSQRALQSRRDKFNRNLCTSKCLLHKLFNRHLGNKGISGTMKVNYDEKTLQIEVTMPQDASSTRVQDTRALSGGERSFSTLCFALALHQMTEAPFRAMDEFDVFMDAVSRKISLDTVVDFALAHGSQWIFITPHDISMVKQDDRVKKQQMAAPRS